LSQIAHKKVFVTRFDRGSVTGFVDAPGGFGTDILEVLTPFGTVLKLPYSEIKVVSYVRDFEGEDPWRPNRAFATRPKTTGLWVRLLFRDNDTTEGILPNSLLLVEPVGFQIIPPDPTFHNQRIFVPRAALLEAQVLGVIGIRPVKRPAAAKTAGPEEEQLDMFS
jgi:hypothetical protein